MADNITIKDGADADQVVACDEVTRNATPEKQQIVKIGLGAEGAHDLVLDSGQQAMAASLPVALASDQASVPVAATLQTGSATVGKLAANTGVDIGDVDVTSVVPGVGATNLGKAEDAPHTSGDVGVMMLGVRNEGNEDFSGTDGDYLPVAVDAKGHLMVRTGDGALDVTLGAETTKVIGTVNVAAGQTIAVTQPTAANLKTEVSNAGTFAVQAAATLAAETTKVIGTVNVAGSQTIAVTQATPANLKAEVSNLGTFAVQAAATLSAETTKVIGTVNVAAAQTITAAQATAANLKAEVSNAGTFVVQATLQASTNTQEVVGDAAHDAAAAGNPVLAAGIAQDSDDTAPPNRVAAEGRATRLATDRDGAQFVRTHGPQVWSYHANGSTALTDASVHASPGAGLSLYVTSITVSSGAATAMNVFFEEGSTTVLGPYYLEAVAGRGFHLTFPTPKKITAATALTVTTSAAIAHSVDVIGFTAQG